MGWPKSRSPPPAIAPVETARTEVPGAAIHARPVAAVVNGSLRASGEGDHTHQNDRGTHRGRAYHGSGARALSPASPTAAEGPSELGSADGHSRRWMWIRGSGRRRAAHRGGGVRRRRSSQPRAHPRRDHPGPRPRRPRGHPRGAGPAGHRPNDLPREPGRTERRSLPQGLCRRARPRHRCPPRAPRCRAGELDRGLRRHRRWTLGR